VCYYKWVERPPDSEGRGRPKVNYLRIQWIIINGFLINPVDRRVNLRHRTILFTISLIMLFFIIISNLSCGGTILENNSLTGTTSVPDAIAESSWPLDTVASTVEQTSVTPTQSQVTELQTFSFLSETVHVGDENIIIQSGAVSGRVLYYDWTPAYPMRVYLYSSGSSESTASASTDKNGYYTFDNVSSGILSFDGKTWIVSTKREYDVYPASNISFIDSFFINSNAPHKSVNVFAHKLTIVDDILIPKPDPSQ